MIDHDIQRAEAIARDAHMHQTDKAGEDYIGHPERVAARARWLGGGFAEVVGWLHDVIEDTDWEVADLLLLFPPEVVDAVEAITHRPHEPREAYYDRVLKSPLATIVKLCDVADNDDPERMQKLALKDPETYARLTEKHAHARRYLLSNLPRA